MATYNKIQFIAFEIKTSPKKDPKTGKEEYVGIPCTKQEDGRMLCPQDIEMRCQLMLDAILTAQQKACQDKDVLKVFMAPEFFFRGPNGAYEMENAADVIAKLQDMVKDSQWQGWMFVFGTIVAVSYQTKKQYWFFGKQVIDTGKVKEAYNFSLVQVGGYSPDAAENHCRVVMKEFKSGIDFLGTPGEGFSDEDVKHLDASVLPGVGREQSQVGYSGLSVFDFSEIMSGLVQTSPPIVTIPPAKINFALDICLDHSTQRTAKSPLLPGGNMVQVQLIPSCGMSIIPNSLVIPPGGFVFNVDGYWGCDSSDLKRASGVHVLNPYTFPSVKCPVQVTHFSPPQPVVDVTEIFDSATPGNIRIYESVNTPPPQQVDCNFIVKELIHEVDGNTNLKFRFFIGYNLIGELYKNFLYVVFIKKNPSYTELSDIIDIPREESKEANYDHTFLGAKYYIETYYDKGNFSQSGKNYDYGIFLKISKDGVNLQEGFFCPIEGKIDIPSSPPVK